MAIYVLPCYLVALPLMVQGTQTLENLVVEAAGTAAMALGTGLPLMILLRKMSTELLKAFQERTRERGKEVTTSTLEKIKEKHYPNLGALLLAATLTAEFFTVNDFMLANGLLTKPVIPTTPQAYILYSLVALSLLFILCKVMISGVFKSYIAPPQRRKQAK